MYRILLVDDEALVREAIAENMEWAAMDCELVGTCSNGLEAKAFLTSHPVDIVLTDICMPFMDGMELCHFLHDNLEDVVIVIFSGFNDFEYAKKAIQYNASEYILKPVTAQELSDVLERMKKLVDERSQKRSKMEAMTQASENYKRNEMVFFSKAMESLVCCTRSTSQSLAELSELGIEIPEGPYQVAVFDMDLYREPSELEMVKRQESALMAFVLLGICSELLKEEKAGIAYQEGNNRVCALLLHREEGKNREICRRIQEKVKEDIGIGVSVLIGSTVDYLQDLALSHDEAISDLQYHYLLGNELLLERDQLKTDVRISIREELAQIQEAFRIGEFPKLEEALDRIYEKIKKSMVYKSRVCMFLQQVIYVMQDRYTEVLDKTEILDQEAAILLGNIAKEKTFETAMGQIRTFASHVFSALQEVNTSSGQRHAVLAMNYIQTHYMDPQLSLNTICSYLSISTSYFSSIFKEETGETFMEVLIRTRMKRAKELLEHTTMKNYEIAERVGFSDPHYFGISFKKATGMTPTEYGKKYREGR